MTWMYFEFVSAIMPVRSPKEVISHSYVFCIQFYGRDRFRWYNPLYCTVNQKLITMPKVVFTHAVKDVDHWLSKHSERIDLFSEWGSNVSHYASADGSNNVALTADVFDMDKMQAALASPELAKGKEAHGVIDPVLLFVAPE